MKKNRSSYGASRRSGIALGVTLDLDAVRLVYCRQGRLHRWQTAPYPDHTGWHSAEFPAFLKDLLESYKERLRSPACWVQASLPSLQVRYLRIPKARVAQRPALVYWTYRKECPFDTDTQIFDYAEEGEVSDASGKSIWVTACTVAKAEVDQVQSLFEQAGSPLAGLIIPHVALRNLYRAGWVEHANTNMSLFVGEEASSVQIHNPERVTFNRLFKTGIVSLLQDAGDGVTLLPHLRAYAAGDAVAEERMQPALDRLARQMERTLNAYLSLESNGEVQRLQVAGQLAAWPRVLASLRDRLSWPVEPIDIFDESRLPRHVSAPEDPCERALFTMAAATALSTPEQTPNLLDTQIRRQLAVRRQRTRVGWAAALVMAGLAVVGARWGIDAGSSTLQASLRARSQELSAYDPVLTPATIEAQLAKLEAQHQRLNRLAQDYRPAALIYEIGQLTPPEVRLRGLRLQLHPVWVQESGRGNPPERLLLEGSISGEEVPLDDPQVDLIAYVMALDDHPLLDSVSILQSAQDSDGALRFEIMARPVALKGGPP